MDQQRDVNVDGWRRIRRLAASIWVRAFATALLLGIVAAMVEWDAAADRLAEGSWGWFLAAVLALFTSQLIAAWRWWWLLDGAGLRRPIPAVVRAFLIGAFANSFLPTAFGGDFVRSWLLASPGPPLVRALLSVVVDRFVAFGCLVALAWITLPFDAESVPTSLQTALLAITLGGAAVTSLLLWLSLHARGALVQRLPERVKTWAREIRATLRLYVDRRRVLAMAVVLGLAFQALVVVSLWCLARSIGLYPSLALLAFVVPLVLLVTLVPISIAGFGVREGGMVLILGAAGYSATDATLLSLLSVAALVLASLPGAGAMVFGHAFPSREELESAETALREGDRA